MLAELPVDVEFFRGEFPQHLFVSTAVGFSNGGAEFSLAALQVTMLQSVERILDLLGHRLSVGGIICVLKGEGENNVAVLIGRGVKGVGWSGSVGEGFEQSGGGKAVVPLGMMDEPVGGEGAGGDVLG